MRPLDINTAQLPSVNATCNAIGFGAHNESNGTVTGQVKRSATEKIESVDATTIAVKMVSGVADHGDSGGPLLCDGRISAVVHNHTDGDWPSHIRENYATLTPNLEPAMSVFWSDKEGFHMKGVGAFPGADLINPAQLVIVGAMYNSLEAREAPAGVPGGAMP
jgi:hypothetical protein